MVLQKAVGICFFLMGVVLIPSVDEFEVLDGDGGDFDDSSVIYVVFEVSAEVIAIPDADFGHVQMMLSKIAVNFPIQQDFQRETLEFLSVDQHQHIGDGIVVLRGR